MSHVSPAPIDAHSTTPRSDGELIELSKRSDSQAFAELWKRHSTAGRTVARSFTSTFDPDDLVAEAFTRIYQLLQKGKGPTGAFRPYLFTTIRNTAASWGRARRETSLDTLESLEDPSSGDEASIAALDKGLTATAFRSLPTRWQEVLWYSEVEAMTPAQIAPLLGMSANSVAALSYRAREGLRQAWITAHLNSNSASEDCKWSIDRLGGYTRGSLSTRDNTRLEKHLDECARCTIAASEAHEVGSRLALVLLPLTAGAGGAAAYTHWLQTGGPAGHAAAALPMPDGITGTSATIAAPQSASGSASSTSSSASSTSAIVTASVIGGLILAASVATAVTLGPSIFEQRDAVSDLTSNQAPWVDEQTLNEESTGVEPLAPVQPDAVAPPVAPPPVVPAPVDDSLAVDAAPTPDTQAVAPPVTPPVTPPIDPQVDPPIIGPVTPASPAFSVDTADGRFFPVFSGTGAVPNATITISVVPAAASIEARPAAQTTVVTAASDGSWSATLTELTPGAHLATATQTAKGVASEPSAAQTIELVAPTISLPADGAAIPFFTDVTLNVAGTAGADIVTTFSTTKLLEAPTTTTRQFQLDAAGFGSTTFEYLLRPYWDAGTLTVHYTDGSRVGPAVSISLVRV